MKSTYTVTLIQTANGSRNTLSQHTRKADAVAAAKKGATKGSFGEVLAEIPGVVPHVIFQGKTAPPHVSTHIGFKESHGTDALYDGHCCAVKTGTVEEIIAHLESFLYLDNPEWESLKWQGPNGWFFQGDEAGKMLRAQIAALKDGSHSCFDLQD